VPIPNTLILLKRLQVLLFLNNMCHMLKIIQTKNVNDVEREVFILHRQYCTPELCSS
jgi:hypothetical protein